MPRWWLRRSLAALVALALAACSPPVPSFEPATGAASAATTPAATQTPAPSPTADRDAGWRSDLEGLLPAMERIHPDLFHGTPRDELEAAVAEVVGLVPTLTDDQLLVSVLHLVAMVSANGCDAHTGAFIWGTGTYPVDSLPLRLWLFGDEVVIVDALPPYENLVGRAIATINDSPMDVVIRALDPIIPRDNEQTVRLLLPRYLLIPQVLWGAGAVPPGEPIALGLSPGPEDQAAETVEIMPIPMADYNAWAGPYGLHLPADPRVQYLARLDDALWWAMQPDGETLYVQYNRVDALPGADIAGLRSALREDSVRRVVLDLRNNFGGEVSALDAMLALFEDPGVNRPGRLFVITGRNTFSAASLLVARLDANTEATFVGEPMGGCPTLFGNPSEVTLPFSGIVVSVAGTFTIGVSADDPRKTIEPDIPVELTREDWASGSDPALGIITTAAP